jgi:hypothetical protein
MRAYATEEYTQTIYVFSSRSVRDKWIKKKVSPEKELRNKITLRDAKKLRKVDNFIKFLDWQETELLKGGIMSKVTKATAYFKNIREFEKLELGSIRQLSEIEKLMIAQEIAIKGALAALSQNAVFPADIAAAKKWLSEALQ